jgi:DNA-binding CsgD family transcriptional regulator
MKYCDVRDTKDVYRKAFTKQLAVSVEADIIYMGFFDCRHHSLVDWWAGYVSRPPTGAKPCPVPEIISDISYAVQEAGRCLPSDGLHLVGSQSETAEFYWQTSCDYRIGVGRKMGHFVPIMAIVGCKSCNEHIRETCLRMGMSYVTQELYQTVPAAPPPNGDAIKKALSMLSLHFAVVDPFGEIDCSTDLSEDWLTENGGFELIGNRLSAVTQKAQKKFYHALRMATGPTRKPSIIPLRLDEGRSKIVVIMPVKNSSPPRALVVFEQGNDDPILLDHLLKLSGLTNSERRVTHHILEGKSLAEVAQETNLSLSTVRSYMKGIFAKTRTHRQSELITYFQNAVPRVKYAPPSRDEVPKH